MHRWTSRKCVGNFVDETRLAYNSGDGGSRMDLHVDSCWGSNAGRRAQRGRRRGRDLVPGPRRGGPPGFHDSPPP